MNSRLYNTIYNWFDFFMYMNILMSQVDMLFIEIIADLIMTFGLTTYYVKSKIESKDTHGYERIED